MTTTNAHPGMQAEGANGARVVDDSQLQNDVVAELRWDNAVNAAHIGVAVNDGAVALTGHVDTYAKRLAAVAATKRVRGVLVIADELEVHAPGTHGFSDTDIAEAAERALTWLTTVPTDAVVATVSDRVLTLEGSVEREFQRRAAEHAVEGIRGVRWVRNLIALSAMPAEPDIHTRIQEALVRDASIESDRITVSTEGQDVHLRGRVRTWAERDTVENAAWSAPGVARVHNHLHIG